MNFIWDKITEWLKGLLVSGIISNLSGLFDAINTRVGEAAAVVGTTPQAWHGGIFQMIRSLSENVVVPIAGIILTFIMCLELIQMLIDRNSLHDFDTFLFFHGKQTKSVKLLDSLWFSDPCNASDYHFDYLDVEVNILSTLRMAFSSFFSVRCAYIRIIIVSSSCPIQRAAVLMSTSAS